ncbi:hypothetical protein ABZ816_18950 [Actinosynnema sp. NPDC047251]|uniref:hypothetical protein n=1 Tax=Saccharothrix espanaensis TaxID=103731 RepID=UPI0002FBCB4F|nr:hypothetical protein [Saccharothrix espanaensis]
MLDRRTFVLGTALAATATAITGTAAHASPRLDKTAGAATAAGSPVTLARLDGRWVLADETGSVRITTGLDNADVVDLADDGTGLIAAGSLAGDPVAALWTSPDGVAWREVRRLHGTRSEFTAAAGALALGSVLRGERASLVRVAARRTATGWTTVPVRGLELTDGLSASALAATPDGWVCAAVGTSGTRLHASRDGVTWTELPALPGVAVRGLTADARTIRWHGNEIAGSTPLTGVLGGPGGPAAVPADAKALGATGGRFAWLSAGRLLTTS